jgi:hypothetical protein
MKITKIIRQRACLNGSCPGLIITNDGNVLIQGRKVDVSGAIEIPADESVVVIPSEVFAELVRQYAG